MLFRVQSKACQILQSFLPLNVSTFEKKTPHGWILAKQLQFQYTIIWHFFGRFLEPTIVAFITSIDSASQLVLGQIDKEASPKRAWGPVPGT